ncbi:LPD7 domain-containing protein, partial [Campylobacter jejuni]|uniref:LPD7 domain-containing protein n=1 Tax=Campylobacter jejuni TaxID=197 RepID=UPI001002C200
IGGDCEANRTHKEALALKNQIIKNAIETYSKTTGQRFQAKSYEWSAVVNIKLDTTMQDLERLTLFLNEKYGFQCYQIAIHRDEGHINEQGQKEINHHAHLEFITLNKENGRNMWRRELITPKVLRQMQSEVAEILEMQRGQDKRITKRQRIEPRKYAQMKEAEKKGKKELKQELLSAKEIKERLEAERKAWILEKNHTAEEYKALRELKNRIYIDKTELEKEINALKERLKSLNDENTLLREENRNLKQEIGLNEANILAYSPLFSDFKTKLISEVYQNIKHDFSNYYFDKEKKEFFNRKLDFKVQDNGDSIALNSKNSQNMSEKVSLMLKMAMAKGWDLDNLNIKGSDKFKAEYYKQITEIQKNKIKELENDLKAKEQKNNEIHQKENKNDLRAISDTQNDKIKLDSINQKINQIKQELATLTKKSQDLEFIEHLSSHNLSDSDKARIIQISENFISKYGESVWLDYYTIKEKNYKAMLGHLKEELPQKELDLTKTKELQQNLAELTKQKEALEVKSNQKSIKDKFQDFTAQQTRKNDPGFSR